MEDEKLICKCESKYDYDAIKQFNRSHMYNNPRNIIVTIIAAILVLYSIFGINTDSYLRIICGIIGIIWVVEISILPTLWSKKAYKTSKIMADAKLMVNFYNEKMQLLSLKNDEKVGESIITYDDIYKVLETNNYIYLYISSNQAYLCKKENFEGDYSIIVQKLKDKLQKKYKIKK